MKPKAVVSAAVTLLCVILLTLPAGTLAAGKWQAAPSLLTAPSISGSAVVGNTLTATSGTWSGNGITYSYQWADCDTSGNNCTLIAGATGSSYLLPATAAGYTLRIYVTASNRYGSATETSAPSAVVVLAAIVVQVSAPTNTTLPAISGSAVVGQSLSASTGTWNGSPTSYTYQWSHCDSTGVSCTSVSGATSATYLLSTTDSGFTIRVAVTATNSGGSATAVSTQTAVVVSSGSEPAPIAGQGYSLRFNEDFTNFSYNNSGSTNDAYTWQRPWNGANNANSVVVDSHHILHLYSDASWSYSPDTLIATRKNPGNYAGSWTYGYFEASINVPAGTGVYPQFWLASLNQIWGNTCSTTTSYTGGTPLLDPEIDVLEGGWEQGGWGTSGTAQYNSTIHSNTGSYCNTPDQYQTQFFPSPSPAGSFHTYAVSWTPTTVTFYLDGVQTASVPAYSSMNQPMYLILGCATHPGFPYTLPSVIDTQVAWVRAWQK